MDKRTTLKLLRAAVHELCDLRNTIVARPDITGTIQAAIFNIGSAIEEIEKED